MMEIIDLETNPNLENDLQYFEVSPKEIHLNAFEQLSLLH